ncbi:Ku protein [Streptomyces sp. NPDC017993]|uniref:non-homologous end joining protein Ku n=1 Tax=Streptomyces sp. NPDC017993 TaxID=3365027 RepID=UPI00379E0A87
MRSIWNGSISFGLVTIPVKTYSATDRTSSVSFVRIHEKDGAQVQYRKICELDGNEVLNEEVGKGYQVPGDDTIVPITDEDLSRLPLPSSKTLTILSFADPDEVDPLQMDKSYYLGPNGAAAAKPYTLLREALEQHGKVAIGKVAMRGRETLAMLRPHDGALVMHALLWPDQIRPATGIAPEDVAIRENELKLAETLMDSLGELDPAELHDDYREAVEQLVSAKLEGGEPVAPEKPAGGQVIDLMAALEKSVRAAQGGADGDEAASSAGGGEAASASVTSLRGRKTAKKSPADTAGKSGAKKSAAKRTTADAGPARKTTGSTAKKTASAPKASGGRAKATSSAGGAASGTSGAKKSTAKSTGKKTAAKKTTPKKSGKKTSA